MALDTKQKQGSSMLMSSPFRPWISEPSASTSAGDRMSFLRFCSNPVTDIISGPYYVDAQGIYIAGATRQGIYLAGAQAQGVYVAGAVRQDVNQ